MLQVLLLIGSLVHLLMHFLAQLPLDSHGHSSVQPLMCSLVQLLLHGQPRVLRTRARYQLWPAHCASTPAHRSTLTRSTLLFTKAIEQSPCLSYVILDLFHLSIVVGPVVDGSSSTTTTSAGALAATTAVVALAGVPLGATSAELFAGPGARGGGVFAAPSRLLSCPASLPTDPVEGLLVLASTLRLGPGFATAGGSGLGINAFTLGGTGSHLPHASSSPFCEGSPSGADMALSAGRTAGTPWEPCKLLFTVFVTASSDDKIVAPLTAPKPD